jgi:hypothetical protein
MHHKHCIFEKKIEKIVSALTLSSVLQKTNGDIREGINVCFASGLQVNK